MNTNNTFDKTIKYNPLKHKHFSDLKIEIGPNWILYKSETGFGVTTKEIKTERNSIIVFPNRCLIENKHMQHRESDNTFAVFEGVKVKDIEEYLASSTHSKRKFLCTPQGLNKVITAVSNLGGNAFTEFHLLFDECHKWIKDSDYRDDMDSSLEQFFNFKNKGMVSATALRPSDPRFSEQRFKHVLLTPTVQEKKQLTLISTNDILITLKEYLDENPNEHYCIFYNSLSGVYQVMEELGILKESSVYCSKESKIGLAGHAFENAFHTFDLDNPTYSKFNFFTSAFFNGLDIELTGQNPDIIIVTDISVSEHTVIDPYTDTLQIIGRLRSKYRNAVHIFDRTDNQRLTTTEEAQFAIRGSKTMYDAICVFEETSNELYPIAYNELKERALPYASLLDKSGNYSMLLEDNFIYGNQVRNYYHSADSPAIAYMNSNRFDIDFLQKRRIEEALTKNARPIHNAPDIIRQVTEILAGFEYLKGTAIHFDMHRPLLHHFPLVNEAYKRLGADKLKSLDYKYRSIRKALIDKDAEDGKNSHAIIDKIYNSFNLHVKLKVKHVKSTLTELYRERSIPAVAKATDIAKYFEVDGLGSTIKSGKDRAIILRARKYPSSNYKRH